MVQKKKRRLRREINCRIASLAPGRASELSRIITANILALDVFSSASGVLAYCPLPDEVDVTPLLLAVLDGGGKLYLPRITSTADGTMVPVRVSDLAHLRKRSMAILEPVGGAPLDDLSLIDLVIVPGRAFDRNGHRVGRGGGYYDRLFSAMPPSVARVGAAFECQVVDEVPRREWDARVDVVVTENGPFAP
ncbi:MAG: 5-formyltetrahydrofolate cyclo-ligase [Planctomycetes bacterium]|nr:5-formyltetrahydrofolate cyclo-ligase [Planctomycetota bacterium]